MYVCMYVAFLGAFYWELIVPFIKKNNFCLRILSTLLEEFYCRSECVLYELMVLIHAWQQSPDLGMPDTRLIRQALLVFSVCCTSLQNYLLVAAERMPE